MVKKALATAIFSLLWVSIAMWGISVQKREVIAQKITLQKVTHDLSNLDTILKDESTHRESMKRILDTLPKEYSDAATAIRAIELTATANNLAVDMIIDEKTKPENGGFNSVTISIKTSGSYTGLAKFATDISLLPYHTRVDSFEFEETGAKVTATITMRLFMQ